MFDVLGVMDGEEFSIIEMMWFIIGLFVFGFMIEKFVIIDLNYFIDIWSVDYIFG